MPEKDDDARARVLLIDLAIPYDAVFNKAIGSVEATLVLGLMAQLWEESQQQPFHKYVAPSPGANGYHLGYSWIEMLGFRPSEFTKALDRVGQQLGEEEVAERQQLYPAALIWYWQTGDGRTWWAFNEERHEQLMDQAYEQDAEERRAAAHRP